MMSNSCCLAEDGGRIDFPFIYGLWLLMKPADAVLCVLVILRSDFFKVSPREFIGEGGSREREIGVFLHFQQRASFVILCLVASVSRSGKWE